MLKILNCFHCTHGIQKYYALEPYLQCPTNQMHRGSCLTPSTTGMWQPPKSIWLKKRWDVSASHFAFARAVTRPGGRGQQSYIHTHSSSEHREVSFGDPAQPGFAGEEVRHSRKRSRMPSPQVTLHGLQGCHRLHVSTNTQLTAMRNVSASLPLKTQPLVFSLLRKTAINKQTMQRARPKEQAASRDEPQFPLVFLFSPQCEPATQWSVNWQAGSAWNNSKRKWIHRSLKWAGNLYINPIPAWQTVHLWQDNLIDLSTVTADLYDCDRMLSLQGLMKWQHWFTLYFLLSTQACYWIIHLTAYRSLLFYCLWLGN